MIKERLQLGSTVGIFAPVKKLQLNCFKKHLRKTPVKLKDCIVQLGDDAKEFESLQEEGMLKTIDYLAKFVCWHYINRAKHPNLITLTEVRVHYIYRNILVVRRYH